MKPHYITTKVTLLFFAVLHIAAVAQNPVEYLQTNNVSAPICIGGNLFYNTDTSVHVSTMYEIPKGSGISSIFSASLWVTATDASGNLKCAAQQHSNNGRDYYDGPVNSNGVYNAAYDSFYRRVFKITRGQIETHVADFIANPFQLSPNNIAPAILYWPAKGNPYVAATYGVTIADRLAPFYDADGDGIYDPVKGDHPGVCGDEAIFFVFNDIRGPHNESGGQPLGIEVRGLAEAYADSLATGGNSALFQKKAINNTTFVQYEIENKSTSPLFDLNIALYYDADLGCYTNDGVACDTSKDLMFFFNRTSNDQDCQGVKGYKNIKAATGAMLLSGNYSAIAYFSNEAPLGYNSPATPQEFRNYTQGLWANGQPYIRRDGDTTLFVNCGEITDTAVQVIAQSGASNLQDKRMLGSTVLAGLPPAGTTSIDYAFITSLDSTATLFTIVDTLKRDSEIIKQYYHNNITGCRGGFTTGVANVGILQARVYPNPATAQLVVETPEAITSLEISNLLGQVVLTLPGTGSKQMVDVSALAKGIYLLKVSAGVKEAVNKVVIE